MNIINPNTNNQINPLGLDTNPRFSWQIKSDKRGLMQSAYQIRVALSAIDLEGNKHLQWNSEKVFSDQSIWVDYNGSELKAKHTYYWQVRAWDENDNVSGWSEIGCWQMGLLKPEDRGNAQWIALDKENDADRLVPGLFCKKMPDDFGNRKVANHRLPIFRKEFIIRKSVKRATLFISGLGHFEATINGQKTTENFLEPGWTNYDRSAQYGSYDVTSLMKTDENAIAVMLGNGMYSVPNKRHFMFTGSFGLPKLILQLYIEYSDGSTDRLVSDKTWKTSAGPIVYSSIFGGEDYDATLDPSGWRNPGYDDSGWKQAVELSVVSGRLKSQSTPPLKAMESFMPVKITEQKPGLWIYDMGQNSSGIPAIEVSGKRGSKIKITPGELLDKDGRVTQEALWGPHFYQYTLKGEGVEKWQPKFTYYGFRYLQIEGAVPEGKSNPGNKTIIHELKALHTRSSADQVGKFNCSSPLFNDIFKLIDWSIKSNMTSVITDCPHREKMGWLEVMHLMFPSFQYNYNVQALFSKLVEDMAEAQTEEGLVPCITPEYTRFSDVYRQSPEWGVAAIVVPRLIYKYYGDTKPQIKHYQMMQAYHAYLSKKAKNKILDMGIGDWFDVGSNPPGPCQLTPTALTGTAFYFRVTQMMTRISGELKKPKEAAFYRKLAEEIRHAFNQEFFDAENFSYASGSQTALALALEMKLVPLEFREQLAETLFRVLEENDYRITAGDIGHRYLVKALEHLNRPDLIYKIYHRNDVPGYGYQVACGATSLTESWEALPSVSQNHCMLGHLMEWFYTGLGGIRFDRKSGGFKKIIIRPQIPKQMEWAEVEFDSPYGKIASGWKKTKEGLQLNIGIPANTTAHVYIPTSEPMKLMESGNPIDEIPEIEFIDIKSGFAVYRCGSGVYKFNTILQH